MTSIYEVLDHLRAAALSEYDKGARFERLVRAYLRSDPVYADQFSDVWLWSEWPGNTAHDTGIDLVAADRITGALTAIQCKFFAPSTTVSKPMIDSFLSASGTSAFSDRIIVSTTEKWGSNAEQAIKDQSKPVRRIGLSDLEHSRVDWQFLDPTQLKVELAQLGSRSAVEWIIDRYQVKTDKASVIVNDPNDWSKEVSDPRYTIDLLARIVTVSLETMAIVDAVPALAIMENQNPT